MSPISTAGGLHALHEERIALQRNWWVFLLLGLISVVVGFFAISSSFVATMASVLVFGWLLIIAAVAEVIHAIMVRNLRGFALHLLAAALYGFAGLFMIEDPIQAAAVITLLMSAAFLVGGILRIIFSLSVKFHAWPWVLFNGIVDVVLGIMIWNRWPEASLWVIGLFVGIDLLLHGWAWIFLALSVRSAKPATV